MKQEGQRRTYPKKKKPKKTYEKVLISLAVICILVSALFLTVLCLLKIYKVKTVYVNGNVHYSSSEIRDMIMVGDLGDNSIYLSLKYKNKTIEDVPFISAMNVEIVSPDTIKITVYEKSLAGCVEHLGQYVYFDRDGMVVECSQNMTEGVPVVSGLSFDSVVLYEPLPVSDEDIFEVILTIAQLYDKYEMEAEHIRFIAGGNIVVHTGDIKAAMGKGENLDDKVMTLASLMPDLAGQSGTVKLENYTKDSKNVIFKPDK
ncbi:MAG: FtsQ-type POTRA domain-containing protein [Lachnospiraceae bacterium]|nr:FtsQ-type POTRA domain-containing protein [Lachnospiraceae bacterium]